MKSKLYFLGSFFLSIFLFCAKTDPLSGPSTEQGNPVMIGLVMSENQPVAGAQVSVYEYVTIQGSETLGVEVKRMTTNEKGNFYLHFIDTGKYAIQCIHPDSSRYAFKKLSIIDSSEVTDTFNLQTPGCLYGIVSRGGILNSSSNLELLDGDIRVVIIDINRSTITGPDGSYQFFDLPAGNYNIAYYPGGSFFSSYRSNVSVISDSITSIDTVFLKSIPWAAPSKPESLTVVYDTLHASVILQWKPVNGSNILGYVIERRNGSAILEPEEFFTRDTSYIDIVANFETGTELFYTVRAITVQYQTGYPEGPQIVIVNNPE